MENSALLSLLHQTAEGTGSAGKRGKVSSGGGGGGGVRGFLRLFKLFPMLTSGCKMVALLGRARSRSRPAAVPLQLLRDKATTGTLFGYRKGRLILAVQEDPYQLPMFIMELPLLTTTFHKELLMASTDDLIINIRIGLESETKSHKKNLMEEFVWAVYCNGRKIGYSIRRRNQLITQDELYVMQLLRGVSMGAGVLPPPNFPPTPTPTPPSSTSDQLIRPGEEESDHHDQLTYIRARFDRIIGSKDSEALYMINPDGDGATGLDLSIFFLRHD